MRGLVPEAYADYARNVFASLTGIGVFTRETDVAEAVWQAANDASDRLHFAAGADAVALAAKPVSESTFPMGDGFRQ